jgi:hypothetical protein
VKINGATLTLGVDTAAKAPACSTPRAARAHAT